MLKLSYDHSSYSKKITPILKRQGVIKAAFFGSTARVEAREDSDIDLLVKIGKDKTLFDIIGLKLELEEKIGKKVDLVEYSEIKPLLKDAILSEQKLIYGPKKY